MPDTAFASLVTDSRRFLNTLSANNSRDWFMAHKAEYEAQVKRPAMALLDVMAARLDADTGIKVKPKLYRIHRDLRFSKDKTPYHTHLHLQWSATEGAPIAWMLGLSHDYFCAGVGVMGFDAKAVSAWRTAIDGAKGKSLADALAALIATGHRIDPPELKRVPPPHDKDHARETLLRRKSLVVWRDLPDSAAQDMAGALASTFHGLAPVRDHLAAILPA